MDAYPLTDRAEIEECRRVMYMTAPRAQMDWLSEAEQRWGAGPTTEELAASIEAHDWLSAEELGAERDLELWGPAPFEED